MKPQWKLWTLRHGGASWLMTTRMCRESHTSWLHREGAWKLCIQDPSRSSPTCILNSKSTLISPMLSVSSVGHSSELWKLRGSRELPNLQPVGWKWPGALEVQLAFEVRASLWRTLPFTCGVCVNSGYLISELNWRTPRWGQTSWGRNGTNPFSCPISGLPVDLVPIPMPPSLISP